jgi:uncharacterized protein (UPF0333 family)
MSVSLKKLWNDYGIGAVVFLIIALYVFYMLYKYFASKGNSGSETMGQNNNSAYSNSQNAQRQAAMALGVQPSEPLGQNEVFASVGAGTATGYGIPSACNKPNVQNPQDLLPKDKNSEWAQLNPAGKGDLANINLLKAGYHIGIDTIGQTLRNANLQIRSEPPNPQINVGPWNLSTIEPDFMRPPLELGQGTQ